MFSTLIFTTLCILANCKQVTFQGNNSIALFDNKSFDSQKIEREEANPNETTANQARNSGNEFGGDSFTFNAPINVSNNSQVFFGRGIRRSKDENAGNVFSENLGHGATLGSSSYTSANNNNSTERVDYVDFDVEG